ncbi:MAG: peptidase M28, partial [Imperialibacter sp.]
MKKIFQLAMLLFVFVVQAAVAQDDAIVDKIVAEGTDNSQLEILGHQLMDVIGPRLVGTPQMKAANDWAVKTYAGWGISAENEEWGKWKGWERGITHIDMVSPRVATLHGTQLAWSPPTPKKGTTAGLVTLPEVADEESFKSWLPSVKGKFVMVSMLEPTGRPDYNWEELDRKSV